MGDAYQFKGEPLQAAMAKGLILEVLGETAGPERRVYIANEVIRRHCDRGGLPARQVPADLIKRALGYLEEEGMVERAGGNGMWRLAIHPRIALSPDLEIDDAVGAGTDVRVDSADVIREGPVLGDGAETLYLYFLPNDRELARLTGREVWECKIGYTSAIDSRYRILNPKTGFAHPPIIGLEIRSDHAAALERELQSHLREIDAEVEDSPGVEWFYTSPERVQRWFE